MWRTSVRPTPNVQIEIDDVITSDARDYVARKVDALARHSARPLHVARIRLTRAARLGQPVVAHADLDVNGTSVLAHAVGRTTEEAVDLLQAKLRRQLGRTGVLRRRRSIQDDQERPFVVRRRSALSDLGFAEAIHEMTERGYEFCLFTEDTSQQDVALHRVSADRYRLIRSGPRPEPGPTTTNTESEVDLHAAHAAVMTDSEAISALEDTGARFVFFRDRVTDRGRLLYRRSDGNYGLIIPHGGPVVPT